MIVNKFEEVLIMKSIKELLEGWEQPISREVKPGVFIYFNKVVEKPKVGYTVGVHQYKIFRVHDYGEGFYRIHTLDLDGKPSIDNIFYVYCEVGE